MRALSLILLSTMLGACATTRAQDMAKPKELLPETPTAGANANEAAAAPPAPANEAIVFGAGDSNAPLTLRARFGVELLNAPSVEGAPTVDLTLGHDEELSFEPLSAQQYRVHYAKKALTLIQNGREKTQAAPVEGKTYVITFLKEGMTVERDGAPAPRKEGESVVDDLHALHSSDSARKRLASHALRIGEPSDAVVTLLKNGFSTRREDEARFGAVEATLKEARGAGDARAAVFAVHVQVAYQFDQLKIVNDMRGELLLRTRDGYVLGMSLEGPAAIRGSFKGHDVSWQGHATMHTAVAFP